MKRKTVLFVALVIILLILPMCFSVSADFQKAMAFTGLADRSVDMITEKTLCGFSQTTEGFSCNESDSLTVKEKSDVYPYYTASNNGCLCLSREFIKDGSALTAVKYFPELLDLSQFGSVIIPVNCTSTDGKCFFSLTMKCKKNIYYEKCEIKGENWNYAFFDLSGFEKRSEIEYMSLSVWSESYGDIKKFDCSIDRIVFGGDYMKNILSAKYLSPDVIPYNCQVSYTDEYMLLEISGENPSFTFNDFPKALFKNAGYIEFETQFDEELESITVYNSGDFNSQIDKQSFYGGKCVFDISNSTDIPMTFCFNGKTSGEIKIKSISPLDYPTKLQSKYGSVSSCTVNAEKGEITVRGKLTDSAAEKFKNGSLCLFAFDFYEKTEEADLSSLTPIGQTDIASGDFVLRSPLEYENDIKGGLYKKYVAALKNESGSVPICSPVFVNNPEAFDTTGREETKSINKKGFFDTELSRMTDCGATDTAVFIDIGRFFSRNESSGSSFDCGGTAYFYDSSYASEIESQINKYMQRDIGVTLVFTLSDTGSETLNELLIHPGANLYAKYCALNTENKNGLAYLRAMCEYLASKYCFSGNKSVISNVIFGIGVEKQNENYSMGEKGLGYFVNSYSLALRTVYDTFRSYDKTVGILTYIGCEWNTNIPFDCLNEYRSPDFLSALEKETESGGNIAWGIAFDPFDDLTDTLPFYENAKNTTNDFSSKLVTFVNSEVLTDFLKKPEMQYSGACRKLIALEFTGKKITDGQKSAAKYIYNYYKTLCSDVDLYITDRDCTYSDTDLYIDTNYSLRTTYYAPELLGIGDWESSIENYSSDAIIKRNISENEFCEMPSDIKGGYIFLDFSNENCGVIPYSSLENLNFGVEFSNEKNVLSVMTGEYGQKKEYRGIYKQFDVPFDFSNMPYVVFGIDPTSLPQGQGEILIRTVFVSGNDRVYFDGTAKSSEWTELCCDISEFEKNNSVEKIYVIFCLPDGVSGSPQIALTSFKGMSKTHTDKELLDLFGNKTDIFDVIFGKKALPVWYGVLVLLLILVVRRISLKIKAKNKKDEEK